MAFSLWSLVIVAVVGLAGIGLLFGLIWWLVGLMDKDRDKPVE